ncbi:MAG: hypothetical protein FJ125_08840 [Deltaproteobacteria bacterium]|nr:hypothetical protein [Deltaproteobacteria bacterium]
MKLWNLLFGLLLLAGIAFTVGCEETTEEEAKACDPACAEETEVCNTEGETPVCECAEGYKKIGEGTTCVAGCPAADPCGDKYEAATCTEVATGATCACDEGALYVAAAEKCVFFDTVLVVCTGGPELAGRQTQGTDLDAIGVQKKDTAEEATVWCAAEADVVHHPGPGGTVDAAHQNKAGVVGAPDGDALTANTYISMGLPVADDQGFISCKFDLALALGDKVIISEVTGDQDAAEPFDVLACYQQLEADADVPCVKLGSEAEGDKGGGDKFTKFPFDVPALSADALPAGLPAAEQPEE